MLQFVGEDFKYSGIDSALLEMSLICSSGQKCSDMTGSYIRLLHQLRLLGCSLTQVLSAVVAVLRGLIRRRKPPSGLHSCRSVDP